MLHRSGINFLTATMIGVSSKISLKFAWRYFGVFCLCLKRKQAPCWVKAGYFKPLDDPKPTVCVQDTWPPFAIFKTTETCTNIFRSGNCKFRKVGLAQLANVKSMPLCKLFHLGGFESTHLSSPPVCATCSPPGELLDKIVSWVCTMQMISYAAIID